MSGGSSVFRVEYAKSGRSVCKGCGSVVNQDDLRFAIMVRSSKFDGTVCSNY